MTREEASSVLDDYDVNFDGHTAEEIAEAFDVAFRALEQEPCEDCVSRKAVDRLAWEYLRKPTDENVAFYEHFLELPSVTPQEQRKGHWIEHPHECGINWEYSMYECSECHEWAEDDSDFCPNCGADMREEQE